MSAEGLLHLSCLALAADLTATRRPGV